jgi:hypothetical protein
MISFGAKLLHDSTKHFVTIGRPTKNGLLSCAKAAGMQNLIMKASAISSVNIGGDIEWDVISESREACLYINGSFMLVPAITTFERLVILSDALAKAENNDPFC